GGDRVHHARVGVAGALLQPEELARSGVEIHHHWQRRHRAGIVRHRADLFRRGAGARRTCGERLQLVGAHRSGGQMPARRDASGVVMVLVGYGTKAGLAPMHTWKPDAYSEAPVPSAALLGAASINCALYGIMRFYSLAAKCLGHQYPGNLLMIFGITSILVAAPFVL